MVVFVCIVNLKGAAWPRVRFHRWQIGSPVLEHALLESGELLAAGLGRPEASRRGDHSGVGGGAYVVGT